MISTGSGFVVSIKVFNGLVIDRSAHTIEWGIAW